MALFLWEIMLEVCFDFDEFMKDAKPTHFAEEMRAEWERRYNRPISVREQYRILGIDLKIIELMNKVVGAEEEIRNP